jgi:(p)ppGpp synthase/HD superfamily hydrolase
VFAVVLYWRLGPHTNANLAEASVEGPKTNAEVSLEDLQKLLDELKTARVENVERTLELPPLASNPFIHEVQPSAPEAEEAAPGAGEGSEAGEGPAKKQKRAAKEVKPPGRDEILASLELNGTCVSGQAAVAIINGRNVKQGDKIQGFTVHAITKSEVTLRDKKGKATIKVARPKWVLAQ